MAQEDYEEKQYDSNHEEYEEESPTLITPQIANSAISAGMGAVTLRKSISNAKKE